MPQRKPDHRRQHHAQLSAGWSGFVTGNQLTLLQNGEAYFPALEANLVVDNDAFGADVARRLKETVNTDGRRIRAKSWQQQPTYTRAFSWLCYGLLRLMRGISGYERENGRARSE